MSDAHGYCGCGNQTDTPAIKHLSEQQTHDNQQQHAKMSARLRFHDLRHDPNERPGHQKQIEENKQKENGARARRYQPVGDRRKTVALVANRHDNGAVIADPPHKSHSADEPEERRQPAP
jgi:hypothetical protein